MSIVRVRNLAELVAWLRQYRDNLPSWHPGRDIPIPDKLGFDRLFLIATALGVETGLVPNRAREAEVRERLGERKRAPVHRRRTIKIKQKAEGKGYAARWGRMMRAKQLLLQTRRKRKMIAVAAAKARWRKAKKRT
jgi:hypothetical protein